MKKTLLITLIAALLISLVSFAAFAKGNMQGPGSGNGPGFGRGQQGFVHDAALKLTEDQEQKVLKIRQDFQKDTIDLRFAMQSKRIELRNLWNANPLNQAAIEAKTKEMVGLRVQMANKGKAMLEKIKAVLTPEQLKIFESHRIDRQGFGGPRQGGGHGCGMGMMGARN
jgi:Spy/CpxP family protein refolding chaperone